MSAVSRMLVRKISNLSCGASQRDAMARNAAAAPTRGNSCCLTRVSGKCKTDIKSKHGVQILPDQY